MNSLSIGGYTCSGIVGFRAILIQAGEAKNGMVLEAIRIHRKSKDGYPSIWYEFMLTSDR